MTVITYSSAAGRFPKKILEHPSALGNVPETLSKIGEPRTMLDPLENPTPEYCGVKGQRWIDQRDNEGGVAGEKAKRKRQTWRTGVSRERMERRWREEQFDFNRNKCIKEVGGKYIEGEDRNGTNASGIPHVMLTRNTEIKQVEKRLWETKRWCGFSWPFYLKNITERGKATMKRIRWHNIFLWFTLLLFSLCPKPASSQGHFPRMENLAAFKPVSTSPPRSTCGVPQRSSYCQTPSSQPELTTCYQAFCVQDCPYRSSTPPYAPLLLPAHRGSCVTQDRNGTRPGTETENRTNNSSEGVPGGSSSVLFRPVQDGCLVSPPSQKLGALGSLTMALWIKPSSSGEMMLLEKSSRQRLFFSVTVSEQAVNLHYGQSSSQTPLTASFRTEGRLTPERWTHLVLQ
ncbi:hypothetical protein JOQ06_009242, partial [Pogonophryne albipinna]